MQNKLPKKYKNNFLIRIRRFFSGIFHKKKSIVESQEMIQERKNDIIAKEIELNKMKELSNKSKIKSDILNLIEKNPKLIDTLSIKQLKELDSMYDIIIEENDRKIKRMKKKLCN